MNPNNVVGTPNIQAQPVAPAAPTAPAEPVASQPEVNPMTMGPKKSSKGGVIAAILFAVLAAGGIGFGVYTMMNSKKQEDALNDQISTLKKQNDELMDQIAEDGEDGEGSGSGAAIDTKDYIYVGEWGIKIKIPDNLQYVSYNVNDWDINSDYDGTSLCVSAATTGHGDVKPSFIKGSGDYMVCLSKFNNEDVTLTNGQVAGEFYIQGPQAIVGDGTDSDWEEESVQAIKDMLSEDNRTSI